MAVNIQNIVETNFAIESRRIPIGSYKGVLFITNYPTVTPQLNPYLSISVNQITYLSKVNYALGNVSFIRGESSWFPDLTEYGITINSEQVSAVSSNVGLTVSVNSETFLNALLTPSVGTYVFTYDGTYWKRDDTTITLSDYGITISTGIPDENDTITVTVAFIEGTTFSVVVSENTATQNAKIIYAGLGADASDKYFKVAYYNQSSDVSASILAIKQSVSNTEEDFIFVVLDPAVNASIIQSSILNSIYAFESPYKVIVCSSMTRETFEGTYKDVLISYPTAVKLYVDNSQPTAVTIAAYYNSINLNEDLTVQDYCYTDESTVYGGKTINGTQKPKLSLLGLTQKQYEDNVNVANFTDIVGDSIVNFGGNLTNEVSITAYFGMIVSDNDIIFAVLRTMLNKQYLTAQGLNNIVAAINSALRRYIINGYLEQNAQYGGQTYVENYNGISYTLIKEGTSLPTGYFVATIPMSRLKTEDRKEHKFTPIRVFLQTQAGARVVEINGTVIE